MPAKKSTAPEEIFQIKVTLLGARPPIWRRLLVPASTTLARLHNVLQAAMGWKDCHLHEFFAGRESICEPPSNPWDAADSEENSVLLSSVLARVGSKITYIYDFGDSWEHSIALEKRLPADPNLIYPRCTGGMRAGPPEDCGGIWGYYDLLEVTGDPSHPRHGELKEWLGDEFDPEAFSIDDINGRLACFQRPAKRGKASRG